MELGSWSALVMVARPLSTLGFQVSTVPKALKPAVYEARRRTAASRPYLTPSRRARAKPPRRLSGRACQGCDLVAGVRGTKPQVSVNTSFVHNCHGATTARAHCFNGLQLSATQALTGKADGGVRSAWNTRFGAFASCTDSARNVYYLLTCCPSQLPLSRLASLSPLPALSAIVRRGAAMSRLRVRLQCASMSARSCTARLARLG